MNNVYNYIYIYIYYNSSLYSSIFYRSFIILGAPAPPPSQLLFWLASWQRACHDPN